MKNENEYTTILKLNGIVPKESIVVHSKKNPGFKSALCDVFT